MSVQRSPPNSSITASSSQPDLSKVSTLPVEPHITFRKRKQPLDYDCNCSEQVREMHVELSRISSLFEKYVTSNEEIKTEMQSNTAEIKNQIREIKLSNEQIISKLQNNITEVKLQLNEIKSSTSSIISEQKDIKSHITCLETKLTQEESKIISIESQLKTIQSAPQTPSIKLDNQIHVNEQIIREMQDRKYREKNIILVGLPEQQYSSIEERNLKEFNDVLNITSSVNKDIPKPIKVIRIGKYTPGKARRIKIFYESAESAKELLRNKNKFPEHVKIFSDQTPAQQKYLNDLKQELTVRNNNGENNLTIKYIKGTPTIVHQPPKNFKQ